MTTTAKVSASYKAEIFGSSWTQGPSAMFRTITAAREWAESYGTTADRCTITKGGKVVAVHVRDTSGSGDRWFRAAA